MNYQSLLNLLSAIFGLRFPVQNTLSDSDKVAFIALMELAINSLEEREQEILTLRFGLIDDKQTLKQVAATRNVSIERIRQIEAKALRRLRHPMRSRALQPYADALSGTLPIVNITEAIECIRLVQSHAVGLTWREWIERAVVAMQVVDNLFGNALEKDE